MAIFEETPVLEAQAKRLEGLIAEAKSQVSQAMQAYRAGLNIIDSLLREKVFFYKNLGWAEQQRGDWEQA